MRLRKTLVMFILGLFVHVPFSHAHFGMILPSDDVVSVSDTKEVVLDIMFIHPFEDELMNMARPSFFGVLDEGSRIDLTGALVKKMVNGFTTWKVGYRVKRPGDKIFFVEPSPYWEPSEEAFIVHYTKVVVGAMGLENQWDREVGLKAEIIPLTRPYGLWAGNLFQGIVKVDGKPLPYARVEVEYYNRGGRIKAPDDTYITQVVKTDSEGVFTYAMPLAGWWGFAALSTADFKMKHDGRSYPVELGAVIWVETRQMK